MRALVRLDHPPLADDHRHMPMGGASGELSKAIGFGATIEAVAGLVHLMGDLHQPLHVGGTDLGGNLVKVNWMNRWQTNLHSAWDDEMVAADAVESLDGNARGYSEAFAAVDRLLEQAAALLSQTVVYGPVRRLGPILRAERLHGGDGWTEIIVPEPWPPVRLAEIELFNSPALANAMLVEGMTIQLGRTSGVVTVRGSLLPDSASLRV